MNYTQETIDEILSYSSKNYSSRQIAELLMISKSGVNNVINRHKVDSPRSIQGPRIVFLDYETAAAKVYAFGRKKQFISQDAVSEEGGWLVSAGYKWQQADRVQMVYDKQGISQQNDRKICETMWEVYNQADVIVAHNLRGFDHKVLQTRCIANGLPTLPYVKTIDTLDIARKLCRFPDNKLDTIAAYLGVGRKVSHAGISLWKDVQEGDEKSLEAMLEYNEQDVLLLEDVFKELASRGLVSDFNAAHYYDDDLMRCHICGSTNVSPTGRHVYTAVSKFDEHRCGDCGAIGRNRTNRFSVEKRKNLLTNPKG